MKGIIDKCKGDLMVIRASVTEVPKLHFANRSTVMNRNGTMHPPISSLQAPDHSAYLMDIDRRVQEENDRCNQTVCEMTERHRARQMERDTSMISKQKQHREDRAESLLEVKRAKQRELVMKKEAQVTRSAELKQRHVDFMDSRRSGGNKHTLITQPPAPLPSSSLSPNTITVHNSRSKKHQPIMMLSNGVWSDMV